VEQQITPETKITELIQYPKCQVLIHHGKRTLHLIGSAKGTMEIADIGQFNENGFDLRKLVRE